MAFRVGPKSGADHLRSAVSLSGKNGERVASFIPRYPRNSDRRLPVPGKSRRRAVACSQESIPQTEAFPIVDFPAAGFSHNVFRGFVLGPFFSGGNRLLFLGGPKSRFAPSGYIRRFR